jgi:hypothetical protein
VRRRALAATLLILPALALSACGGGDTTTIIRSVASQPTTSSTRTVTTTTASSDTTVPVIHAKAFQTPGGNIGCIVFNGTVRCDIKSRSWSPPARPASCSSEVDFGQGIEVGNGKARFVCAGDTALNPQAQDLPDGEKASSGSLECTSAGEAIRCTNSSTGHGFTMSGSSYTVF